MKTYAYLRTDSPERGYNVRITVFRIKRNRPIQVGYSDHNTASWMGERPQAYRIIHDVDGIPFDVDKNGGVDRYRLRGEVEFSDLYDDKDMGKDAIRLFSI